MRKLLRGERILQAIDENTATLDIGIEHLSFGGLDIQSIAKQTGIASNNVSTELVQLYKGGKLIKVGGRPVYYLSKNQLQQKTGLRFETNHFSSADMLETYLRGGYGIHRGENQTKFDTLIGARKSLALPIRQAKAAVRYPPHGLHTLITGPTGVGKSLFAQCMYDYARASQFLPSTARLVTLNCANYAENPQLLLSQLFGYVKGAFTGANTDHKGMVEYASGGILFLDEIHRLNPEGQEKLFRLIDYGKYSRLGETGDERTAHVLIIGATTENVSENMQATFLRRIPVHIELPALNCRSVEERLELVLHSFWKEAQNIQVKIEIDIEILDALCFYNCPANLGQLSTDVKITCANAYFDHLPRTEDELKIKVHHLNQKIIEGLFITTNHPSLLVQRQLLHPERPLQIDGRDSFDDVCRKYLVPSD